MSQAAHEAEVIEQLKRLADGLRGFADATDASTARSAASYQDLSAQINRLATGVESFRDASDVTSTKATVYQAQLIKALEKMNSQLELMTASLKATTGNNYGVSSDRPLHVQVVIPGDTYVYR